MKWNMLNSKYIIAHQCRNIYILIRPNSYISAITTRGFATKFPLYQAIKIKKKIRKQKDWEIISV